MKEGEMADMAILTAQAKLKDHPQINGRDILLAQKSAPRASGHGSRMNDDES